MVIEKNFWWKKTVFYQIYMPSFYDGNQDGIGDFKGITEKLPYLKDLGIGDIWLTPFYTSPKVDNGYDISDYYTVDPDYGTMEDFDNFIMIAHSLGLHVIIDMVLNHTSNQHEWFHESKSSLDNSKRDWYIWRKPLNGGVPNNWESFFGLSAWEYDEKSGEYYYHSFAKEQVDLNWSNHGLKQEIYQMLKFWIDKGIDGFRLDVINNLTLHGNMPDNPYNEQGKQIHEKDVNQDGIHDMLKELRQHLNQYKDIFLVGEISSDKLDVIHSFVSEDELDTTFNFNLGSKEVFEISDFFGEIHRMDTLYKDDYPTLFFGSHDMGRFRSRFQLDENEVKLLATFMLTFRGIPFIYFGEEIGMESRVYKDITHARDVQGIMAYKNALLNGKSTDEALEYLNKVGRDKSRNVMQWSNESFGGFSKTEPWISIDESYKTCNVTDQLHNSGSLLNYYKSLIKLRNSSVVLQIGALENLQCKNGLISYTRVVKNEKMIVLLNFSDSPQDISNIIALNENESRLMFSSRPVYKLGNKIEGKQVLIIKIH